MTRLRGGLSAALLVAAALAAPPSRAAIPGAGKIADAVADASRQAGRAEPLLLEVQLRVGGSDPVARGVLASHPTGLARLELRNRLGFVERHLLQGSEYRASRNGELLEHPHPFLPPVFLLQASSGAALRAALSSFGVAPDGAVLGYVDEQDCYVFGGRTPGDAPRPSFWVDLESYEVVRIDRADGVRFRFGPSQDFGGVRAPGWIAIEAPGSFRARLEILRVAPASAPAASFGADWLVATPAPLPAAP